MTTIFFVIETDGNNALRLYFDATFKRDADGDWSLQTAICTRIVLMLGHGRDFRTETVDMAAEYEDGGREYTAWLRGWLKSQKSDPRVSVAGRIPTVDLWEMLDSQREEGRDSAGDEADEQQNTLMREYHESPSWRSGSELLDAGRELATT